MDIDAANIHEQILLMCEQRWEESETLDFKQTLPSKDDRGRRELLKDVCAFANSNGGTLIFGIEEADGAAAKLRPIADESSDAAILRLGQTLDANIEPRIRGLRFRSVEIDGGYILVGKVPASFAGPHRYLVNDASRFVMRSGRHTIDMTYQQLRNAFGNLATLAERAKELRSSRLALVPRSPFQMRAGPIAVVHLIPLEGLAAQDPVEVTKLYYNYSPLVFSDWGGGSRVLNLDGMLAYAPSDTGMMAYTMLMRSGAVEAARFAGLTIKNDQTIPSLTVADFLREAVTRLPAICTQAGRRGPALFAVAFLRVEGWHLALDRMNLARPPDRANLVLPEMWIEDIESIPEVDSLAKPTLDLLWQAYGEPFCGYYKDGIWAPRR